MAHHLTHHRLLFGAKKIPELAKGLGRGIKTFKSEMSDEKKDEERLENKADIKASELKDSEKEKA